MYDKLDWLTVNQLLAYHTLVQVFKIRKSEEPEYLSDLLGKDNRQGSIIIPNSDLTLAKKSFVFRGAELWNKLPIQIRQSLKIGSFKIASKKWVKEKIPRFLD